MIKQLIETNKLKVHTRNLFEYDEILGVEIAGMPSTTNSNQRYIKQWATSLVVLNFDTTFISKCIPAVEQGYFVLNDIYHFGENQLLLVKRNDAWSWRKVSSINESDTIMRKDGELTVTSKHYIKKLSTVFRIETECNEIIVLNDILVYSGANNVN